MLWESLSQIYRFELLTGVLNIAGPCLPKASEEVYGREKDTRHGCRRSSDAKK